MTEHWLLTKEEMAQVYFASEATSTLPSEAMARAQLRKVAAWVAQRSLDIPPVSSKRFRKVTYWDAEEWAALMREAGME